MRAHLFRWVHRVTGLSVALLVLVFIATGVPLQFTDTFRLGSIGVPLRWVHASYGVHAPARVLISNQVVQAGEIAMVGPRTLRVAGILRGAQPITSMTVVATSTQLLLIPADVDAPAETMLMPHTVERFGTTGRGEIAVQTSQGVLASDDYGANWRGHNGVVRWSEVASVPISESQAKRFGAAHVAWERWLQDLHSGRFFGPVGVWVMTIAGLALLILSVTGFVVWISSRNSDRAVPPEY
jgi:hypothetical protein